MGTLYLVRHGQASFGTEDYDRLSELGRRQCAALGEWLQARGRRFEGVMRGPLERHRQSLAAIAGALPGLPAAIEWPGLAEYDAEAVVRALAADAPPASADREAYRQHFRLLRAGLQAWIDGRVQPEGMPSWRAFAAGVGSALDLVRERFTGDVLLVASGGPIATAIAQVLQAPGAAMIELNLRMHNSAVSEFVYTPKRHALTGYNALPHLDRPERAGWVTYM
ncbi:MAG: fructose 2,6-bisphosphatase [Pseudomonadota bacterium]|nr:histidine phosphatase family protein [Rubrivivax sp.]